MLRKKQNKTLILLFLTVVVWIAAYIGYTAYEAGQRNLEDTSDETSKEIVLFQVSEDDMEGIEYNNEKGNVRLIKDGDGTWIEEYRETVPLNASYTSRMVQEVTKVIASRMVVDTVQTPSEYGLDAPKLSITVTRIDGSEQKILIGNKAPIGDEYYATIDGDPAVYLIPNDLYMAYDYSNLELIQLDSLPSVSVAQIRRMVVDQQEKELLEITYDENNTLDMSGSDISNYCITKGYEEVVLGDSDAIQTYLSSLANLSYIQCVEYANADTSKYGLDDPLASIYVEYVSEEETADAQEEATESYQIQIGDMEEGTENYYVRKVGTNQIYTMNRESIEALLAYDRFALVNKYVQLIQFSDVDHVTIAYGDEKHTLRVQREETTNEDGEDSVTEVYTLDGTVLEEDAAKVLYQSIIHPLYDAEATKVIEEERTKEVSFTFYFTTEVGHSSYVVEYEPYDTSFYQARVNGVSKFLVDRREIQSIVEDIKNAMSE